MNSGGANTRRFAVISRYTGDVTYFYGMGPEFANRANTNSAKYFAMSRTASTKFDSYINLTKTELWRDTDALPSNSLFACGSDPGTINAKTLRFVFLFSYLTEAEVLDVIDITNDYLKNYGTNLIFDSYSDRIFTGEPKRYIGSPLITGNCLFRSINLVAGTYHLWEEVNGVNPTWLIRKRTSADGMSFSAASAAVLLPGGDGEFDKAGQADPTVIYDGAGDWKMWYDAISDTNVWSLGYATSADGDTWVKYGQILAKGGVGTWDSNGIHHPVCVKNGATYYLFYSGGDDNHVKHIGLSNINGWYKLDERGL